MRPIGAIPCKRAGRGTRRDTSVGQHKLRSVVPVFVVMLTIVVLPASGSPRPAHGSGPLARRKPALWFLVELHARYCTGPSRRSSPPLVRAPGCRRTGVESPLFLNGNKSRASRNDHLHFWRQIRTISFRKMRFQRGVDDLADRQSSEFLSVDVVETAGP